MFAQEQADQSLQCLFKSREVISGLTVFASEKSNWGLQCLHKSSLIRVFSVCKRAV